MYGYPKGHARLMQRNADMIENVMINRYLLTRELAAAGLVALLRADAMARLESALHLSAN